MEPPRVAFDTQQHCSSQLHREKKKWGLTRLCNGTLPLGEPFLLQCKEPSSQDEDKVWKPEHSLMKEKETGSISYAAVE